MQGWIGTGRRSLYCTRLYEAVLSPSKQSSRRFYGMGLKVAAIYQDKAETR